MAVVWGVRTDKSVKMALTLTLEGGEGTHAGAAAVASGRSSGFHVPVL
jgi:hypothetical protein